MPAIVSSVADRVDTELANFGREPDQVAPPPAGNVPAVNGGALYAASVEDGMELEMPPGNQAALALAHVQHQMGDEDHAEQV